VSARPLSLFEAYGIEIEATVVDARRLDVRPVVDELLRVAAGGEAWVSDVDDGPIGWSNELVAHVVELKTSAPEPSYEGLAERFLASERRMNALLGARFGARLLPGGMHPWMDPAAETVLWRHENAPVYRAYDRCFDCRRHGWANLQSIHLNLPFADDQEFGRLLAAVRLVLPLVPALAASSPVVEGRATGILDNRLEAYRTNAESVPSMAGDVIPEPIYAMAEYHERVLGALYRDLAARGVEAALLGREWTNARGAIARFERMALEIRLIDAQECAASDLSVAAAVSGLVRATVEERWLSYERQRAWPTAALVDLLQEGTRAGPHAPIADRRYAAAFGLVSSEPATLGAVWRAVAEETFAGSADLEPSLELILRRGTLAERILAALGPGFGRPKLREVYAELCECLAAGRPFAP
jgi:gamma-glutamyl:cysteine ligase YbdK (ATP-grasp superfamily)